MALAALPFLASACSLGTEAWERDLHAEPEMAMEYDSIDLGLDEHIYFSKEASSGGQGFGGGGCGCN
ncbi:MAG: DUF4266 domain-containing protein [Candidatus Krumholzibacteriia bacterium]